jgi:hypothetical protein
MEIESVMFVRQLPGLGGGVVGFPYTRRVTVPEPYQAEPIGDRIAVWVHSWAGGTYLSRTAGAPFTLPSELPR